MCSKKDEHRSPLPQDVASCHDMLEGVLQSLAEKDKRIEELEEIVDQLIRDRYGRKSERYDPNQQALFDTSAEDEPVTEPPPQDNTDPPKRRRGGTGRRRLDPNAPREQRFHR